MQLFFLQLRDMKSNARGWLGNIFVVRDFQVDCRNRKVKILFLGYEFGNDEIAVLRLRQDDDFVPLNHNVWLSLSEVYINLVLVIVTFVKIM